MNGLKSLARELPQYGRYNDDMVAHISSDEARLLKSLGGSGTINPTTGLPEFGMFGIGGGGGILGTGINKGASDPVSNALSNNPISQGVSNLVQSGAGAIDQGLVNLDKTVGKAIPGGWGTVGMVAGSMIPGMTPMMMGGLGALNGSGVLRKGGKFNLQGAMMGGAMAYGMSSLGEYARGAAPTDMSGATAPASGGITPPPVESAIPAGAGDSLPIPSPNVPSTSTVGSINPVGNVGVNPTSVGPGIGGYAPPAPSFLERVGTSFANAPGNAAEYISNIPGRVAEGASNAYNSLGDFATKAVNPDTYTNALSDYGTNVAKTGEGAYNLITGAPGASELAANAAKAAGTTSPMMAAGATIYGGMGLAALEEQKKYLESSKAANAISQAEYDNAMAEITRSENVARQAVAEHPFSTNPNRDVSIGETYYGRSGAGENLYSRFAPESKLYAVGGGVDSLDDQTGIPSHSPVDGLAMGGMGYAAGGTPRFLSGGGDGMSDSIPASIEGKQEARLADGEFVIPADVVSHLGNGSSKAGANQLYSMMDKVRKARTGNPKQGKQINPRKFLAA